MAKCETCRWWKDADLTAQRWAGGDWKIILLGHCEPERHVGGQYPKSIIQRHHCGLTANDYSCGEHQERSDDR